jgi:hypothetical protein
MLGAATFMAALAKLGIFVIGQKIMADSVGDLVLKAGSPVVRFIKGIITTVKNIFLGFFGWGTWSNPAMEMPQAA